MVVLQSTLLHRVAEQGRPFVTLHVDGTPVGALDGDTLLTAILLHGARLRVSEFGDGPRAGFCLMGACQDCWVWTEAGQPLRACCTPVSPGLRVVTTGAVWPADR